MQKWRLLNTIHLKSSTKETHREKEHVKISNNKYRLQSSSTWLYLTNHRAFLHNVSKRVSQSCAERTSAAPKWGLASLACKHGGYYGRSECWWNKNTHKKWHFCCAVLRYILYAKFSQILEVLRDSHRLFGSRNSRRTGILHTVRHVYRSVCPPEKLSLAVAPRSYVLRMIVKLSYSWLFIMLDKNSFTVLWR